LQLHSPQLAPPASLSSTALAALRGTRPGLSPLGDELCKAWELARERYQRFSADAVLALPLHNICFQERSAQRFVHLPPATSPVPVKVSPLSVTSEHAHLLRPQALLREMALHFAGRVRTQESFVKTLRRSGDGYAVHTLEHEIHADVVVLACGAWGSWFQELTEETPLKSLRSVQGSYYQWEQIPLAASFTLSLDGINLFADAPQRRLLLGATTVKDCQHFLPDQQALSRLVQQLSEKIDFPLPPLERAEVKTGIRSVLKGRAPWSGQLADGLFSTAGLYKNGWVSAFFEAKKLAELIHRA